MLEPDTIKEIRTELRAKDIALAGAIPPVRSQSPQSADDLQTGPSREGTKRPLSTSSAIWPTASFRSTLTSRLQIITLTQSMAGGIFWIAPIRRICSCF